MTWNRIIGQNRVKKLLQKAIIEKKIPNSYCFWGQEGTGKDATAIEFARVVNCLNPVRTDEGIEACDSCSSCKASLNLQHRNIHIICPMPAGKSGDTKKESVLEKLTDEQIEEYYEQIKFKAENPYHKIVLTNANQIRIASIRELKKKLTLTSSGEGRVCVLVTRADEMTTEAANAFLKTLEEPHDNITIIITTSRPEALLPTILSRCQQVRFESLSDKDITNALIDRNNLTENEALLISALAQGSYTKAVEFLGDEMKEIRVDAINFLRSILKKKVYRVEVAEHIEQLTKKHDRREIEIILNLLLLWIRDAVSIIKTGKTEYLINLDDSDTLKKFTTGYPNKLYLNAIEELAKAIIQLRKNVAPQLILMKIVLEIRRIFLFS